MSFLLDVVFTAVAAVAVNVAVLFRRMWPDADGRRNVELTRAAAALAALAVAAPMGYASVGLVRLALLSLSDDLLFILGVLFLAPLALLGAAVAATLAATVTAVALGLAGGHQDAPRLAWFVVALGLAEAAFFMQAGWLLAAVLMATATVAEAALLLMVQDRERKMLRSVDPPRR